MAQDLSPRDEVSPVRMQRVTGRAEVGMEHRRGATRIAGLHQSGSAKAFLPDVHGAAPEVVFLNTAGGLTGGDRLRFALTLGAGARAVGTTQTAERAYASAGGLARMEVALTISAGAALDWLPQETILFEGSALARRTVAELGPGACLLMVETVVLGRAAMGEVLRQPQFTDWREVRRNGVAVLVEPVRITAETLARGPAALDGARVVATLALVAPGAEDAVEVARRALPAGLAAAVSGWDGRLVLRLMGGDLAPVRAGLATVATALRGGRPMPRVWQMGGCE